MPKALISTYSTISLDSSNEIKVNKIVSEQDIVPNIQKEVNFGKFSKKLSLRNKVAQTEVELDR